MAMFLDGDDKEEITDNYLANEVKRNLKTFFDRITKFVNSLPRNEAKHISIHNALAELNLKSERLQNNLFDDVTKFGDYLIENISGTDYLNFSASLKREKADEENFDFHRKLDLYESQLDQLSDYHQKWLDRVNYIRDRINLRNELIEEIDTVKAVKLALEGHKTEEIYSEASNTFLSAARNYEVFFYMLIGAALIITVICLAYFPYSEATKVNFIFSKILTATLVITLGTLFLRKAAHLRKLHEQAHQTSLELQALPLFIKSLDKPDQDIIIKDLANKYFGKEVDQTQNDKIGDLMQDQLIAGTELIKASAELVKSVKPSGGNADSGNDAAK